MRVSRVGRLAGVATEANGVRGRWVAVGLGSGTKRLYPFKLEEGVIGVAVPPCLFWLETPDHGVVGSMEVFGGVPVG